MITRIIELECEKCQEKFTEGMTNEPAWSVRRTARERGWKYSRLNGDICPKCIHDDKSIKSV